MEAISLCNGNLNAQYLSESAVVLSTFSNGVTYLKNGLWASAS